MTLREPTRTPISSYVHESIVHLYTDSAFLMSHSLRLIASPHAGFCFATFGITTGSTAAAFALARLFDIIILSFVIPTGICTPRPFPSDLVLVGSLLLFI